MSDFICSTSIETKNQLDNKGDMDKQIKIPENLAKGHVPSGTRSEFSDTAASVGRKWVNSFVEVGGLKNTDRILDIGCGPGRMAIAIGEFFDYANPYIGFDIKKDDIKFCQSAITKEYPNYQFFHINAFNGRYNPKGKVDPHSVVFPAKDGSIDFCISTSVFTHMLPAEMVSYVQQTYKSLAKGGTFFTTFFLLGVDFPENLKKANPRFHFRHLYDPKSTIDPTCRVEFTDDPEKAVGYEKDFIIKLFQDIGFGKVDLHIGEWRGRYGGRHSQDLIVAKKP